MIESFFNRKFYWFVAAACLLYLGIELAYFSRMRLVMDEFISAKSVLQHASQIPYRDFMPYKTILGYYVQLPALLLPGDIWSRLMYVKIEMALINAAAIFFAAAMLSRHFRRSAVCLSILLLITMSTFLERSSDFRVDMMTSWFGLFSLLFLLERRMIVSGALVALSFLVSQKGIYFALSSALALSSYFLFLSRKPQTFFDVFRFGVAALVPICLYLLVTELIGSTFGRSTIQVVAGPKAIALTEMYSDFHVYWLQTFSRNPLFYGAMVFAIGLLFWFSNKGYLPFVLSIYGVALWAFCLWHKQPWPYFFVLLIPTGWVLIASLISHAIAIPRRWLFYSVIFLVALGVAYPLHRIPKVMAEDNSCQRNTVALADSILKDGDTYIDGISMIFDHEQPSSMRWLDKRKEKALKKQEAQEIIRNIDEARPKLVIMNYRIRSLPKEVRRHIDRYYRYLFGKINIYCPTIDSGDRSFRLNFDGKYRPMLTGNTPPRSPLIDGREAKPGKVLILNKGEHISSSENEFRLCLYPEGWEKVANSRCRKIKELFSRIYKF